MDELMERLSAAAAALERAADRLAERHVSLAAEAEESVGRIVATVESEREAELAERLRLAEEKLTAAESRIAEMSAAAAASVGATVSGPAGGRKTLSAAMGSMLAKQGIAAGSLESLESGRFEAGALDGALASLSIEQRLAVKAELLRSGLAG